MVLLALCGQIVNFQSRLVSVNGNAPEGWLHFFWCLLGVSGDDEESGRTMGLKQLHQSEVFGKPICQLAVRSPSSMPFSCAGVRFLLLVAHGLSIRSDADIWIAFSFQPKLFRIILKKRHPLQSSL
jgi:hypothetical protein